jgi:hypothetical protein
LIDEIAATVGETPERLADELPSRFPKAIHASVSKAFAARLRFFRLEHKGSINSTVSVWTNIIATNDMRHVERQG